MFYSFGEVDPGAKRVAINTANEQIYIAVCFPQSAGNTPFLHDPLMSFSANTRRRTNVGLILGQRHRRWPKI